MATQPSSTETLCSPQLPLWPKDMRGLPNVFARSALFGVANLRKGERQNFKRRTIAALKGITLVYTGEELRQDDEDVFLQILHIGRLQPLGTEVRFTAYSLLGELGWTRNSGSYKRLTDCLDRMTASSLAVTVEGPNGGRENFTGSLVRSFRWKESASGESLREWKILLEKEIISLFNPESYSRLDWKVRLKLPPLAKWLHTFYHSHERPFPYKVETFHVLTASGTAELRMFRHKLKKALALLVEHGFFVSASVDPKTDLVVVERSSRPRLLA